MSDLRVVQLKDDNNNPITPYTAAASVYINVNDEWTNVETKIGGMNIDAIQEAQEEALGNIDEQRIASVNKVHEEGDSYRNDINSLSATVKTLDEKVFPLSISTTVTPNYNTLKYSYEYGVTEYGEYVSGTTITVKQEKNSAAAVELYSGGSSHQTLTADMTWGRDIFTLTCTKGSKTSTNKQTRYLCAYGAYGETIDEAVIKNTSVMSRKTTSSSSFTCTVNTTSERQYIWITVPSYLSISKITSAGFDVTMNNYVSINIGDITYKAYRSKNPLQVSTWELSIT